jgi:hypothetical protein
MGVNANAVSYIPKQAGKEFLKSYAADDNLCERDQHLRSSPISGKYLFPEGKYPAACGGVFLLFLSLLKFL